MSCLSSFSSEYSEEALLESLATIVSLLTRQLGKAKREAKSARGLAEELALKQEKIRQLKEDSARRLKQIRQYQETIYRLEGEVVRAKRKKSRKKRTSHSLSDKSGTST